MSVSSLPQRQPLTVQVAEEVRALMARRHVTQMQLRDVLGVSQSGISNRIRGRVPFDANEIGLLADFFQVDPADLLGTRSPRGGPTGGSMYTVEYVDRVA